MIAAQMHEVMPAGPSLDEFEQGAFNPETFSHSAHVFVAWCYLGRYELAESLQRFGAALRRFTASIGQSAKYHETVTWFFIMLVAERRIGPAASDWHRFVRDNPDLLQGAGPLLRRHYSQARLDSQRARQQFLLPDFPQA